MKGILENYFKIYRMSKKMCCIKLMFLSYGAPSVLLNFQIVRKNMMNNVIPRYFDFLIIIKSKEKTDNFYTNENGEPIL